MTCESVNFNILKDTKNCPICLESIHESEFGLIAVAMNDGITLLLHGKCVAELLKSPSSETHSYPICLSEIASLNGESIDSFLESEKGVEDRGLKVIAASRNGTLHDLKASLQGKISNFHRGEGVMIAASKGQFNKLQLLLGNGEISKDHRGEALVLATRNSGNYGIIRILQENGEILEKHIQAAIRQGARKSDPLIIEVLLKNPDVREIARLFEDEFPTKKEEAFITAACCGRADLVKAFLEIGKISENNLDKAEKISHAPEVLAAISAAKAKVDNQ